MYVGFFGAVFVITQYWQRASAALEPALAA
jgi:hypothetical protein